MSMQSSRGWRQALPKGVPAEVAAGMPPAITGLVLNKYKTVIRSSDLGGALSHKQVRRDVFRLFSCETAHSY